MAKAFFSFLGTNKYINCNYKYREQKIENVNFVQEAMIKIFCRDYTPSDKIIVFLTKWAREINWNDTSERKGLHSTLLEMEKSVKIIDIDIKNNKINLVG